MNERIHKLEHSDLKWAFDDSNKPFLTIKTGGSWGSRQEYVDPFPCYSHDFKIVESIVEHCEKRINLKFKPDYFIMPYESFSRTNGYACANEDYAEKDVKKLNPYIVFHGKRICIHPAMTRYLVAHEFGHITEYNLHAILKKDSEEFQKEYAKIRGIEYNKSYGALNWHKNIAEIIANDIRTWILGIEQEFWQHDVPMICILRNEKSKIADFWKETIEKYLS